MRPATTFHQTALVQRPDARGPVAGWGVSLLVHVAAVAWLWHAWLPHRTETEAGPPRRIEVRLVPATLAARQAPRADAPVARVRPMQADAAPVPMPPRLAHARGAATAPAPAATVDVLAPDPAAAAGSDNTGTGTGTDAPAVDIAAARATARLIARESGKGLVALPGRKLVVDPNADRRVVDPLERARRIDCQTARAGSANLLANVVALAVDLAKNAVDDSGCKW